MATQHSVQNKTKHLNLIFSAVVAIALIVYAAYVLAGMYPDVLITAQDRNPFTGDSLYFSEQIARPFGFFQYIGGFLTQFFFYPALGAAILIVIWIACVFVGIKAFQLKGLWRSLMIIPVACLLASELDLGYWVYCNTLPGYWFSQSVAYLCLMLLLWAANATPRKFRIVWYVLIGFLGFPVFGWISYLFTVCFAFSQFKRDDKGKTTATWVDGAAFAITGAAISVFRFLLYDKIPVDDVYLAGFPYFKTATNITPHLSYPFYILVGTTILMSLGRMLPAWKKIPSSVACLLVGIASAVLVWNSIFKDENYHYEIQMTQATMNDDWKSVLNVAEKAKTPSRAMVMLKNIALLNVGQLGSRSFALCNDGREINNPDTLNINIMHIASQLIYFNHGQMNYAMRWCMEFAVPYGFSPYYMKVFARSAEATGEKALAKRYIDRMHSLLFYRDWQPAPLTPIVKELATVYTDSLDNDENSVERYLISKFNKEHIIKSPYHCELSLLYSMIIRDPNNFWLSFYDYLKTHQGTLPVSYEEGYCLFMDQAKTKFPLPVNISPSTTERYKQFWDVGNGYAQSGFNEDQVRDMMRDDWGGTYWWFNAFGRMEY